ncbi:hypothetical protein [Kribbella sp. CA-294648]|uniref:hypothetical protein n=1 Tax=Kribbella sp. CA-294648 TaxID=3239948 RepID=UPI003D8B9D27
MATLPPVPAPPFPVYRLGAGFGGERVVDGWNRLGDGVTGPLWFVALGHISSSGQFAVVVTDGKLSDHAPDDAPSRQATALGDVAISVLLGLISTADASATPSGPLPSPAEVNTLANALGEAPWVSAVLDLDGHPRPFWIYRVGEHVAGCADVGAMAVGFYGKRADLLISTAGLVPVNKMLQGYALPEHG